jgi:hypothetical protein
MSRSRTLRSRTVTLTLLFSLPPSARALAQDASSRNAEAELAPARALFADALQDEQEGRLAVALEKFRRVRGVRNTPAIEYRIASCEEGLGHLVAAAASYESAVRLGEVDPSTQTVTAGARERLAFVRRRIGHLTLTTPSPAPVNREIFIDGAVPDILTEIPLDPGPHLITARAPGAVAFRTEVTLLEGARLTVAVRLPPSPAAPPWSNREPPHTPGARTAGWIAVAGGAALFAGSGVVLLLRQGDIGSLDSACPAAQCPPMANATNLEATRSRALVEGPVALGLAVAGALASGVGLFLLLQPASQAPLTTSIGLYPLGAVVGGAF